MLWRGCLIVRQILRRGRAIVHVAPPPPADLAVEGLFAYAQQGEDYSDTLAISGGTGPYTVTLIGGTLPPGFTLETVGSQVKLSGSDPN